VRDELTKNKGKCLFTGLIGRIIVFITRRISASLCASLVDTSKGDHSINNRIVYLIQWARLCIIVCLEGMAGKAYKHPLF
jgi:hypothetical protein